MHRLQVLRHQVAYLRLLFKRMQSFLLGAQFVLQPLCYSFGELCERWQVINIDHTVVGNSYLTGFWNVCGDSETIGREIEQTGCEDWSVPNVGSSNSDTLACS